MDLNLIDHNRALKQTYDAIICAIGVTCAEWNLLPLQIRVIVSDRTLGVLQHLALIQYPGVEFKKTPIDDCFEIGIVETELIFDENHHFVKGELPFKIMAI